MNLRSWTIARRHAPWLTICAVLVTMGAVAAESKKPVAPAPGPLILEDVPQPLSSRQPRTEDQRDHMEAVALFAAGRMHERREEDADALRCYQRALRYDPQSSTIARAIVPVAVRLKRYGEAVRYVLKAVELEDADPLLLRRLGVYLSEENDWPRAVALYEKALAARGKGKETATDVLLRMELGRLYQVTGKYQPAADNLARVLYAIDHPEEFAIDEQFSKALLGEAGSTYRLMGECFLAASRPQEARAVFEKMNRLTPNKALWQFNLARVDAKTGKPAEALTALETALAEHLHDEGMAPYETLADVLGSLGRKTNCSTGWKSSALPSRTTRRWAIIWPANIERPASSTRPKRCTSPCSKTGRRWPATAAWWTSIGRPNVSTPS